MTTLIDSLNQQFLALHRRSVAVLGSVQPEFLFKAPDHSSGRSFGEWLLRSAGAVEQTFDGITARLWDDPFEWTLPEELSTNAKVAAYLAEVEATRLRGFSFLTEDADLLKLIPAPEELRTIFSILLATLARAEHCQGRALGVLSSVAGEAVPPF